MKLTLLYLGVELMLDEPLKNCSDLLYMGFEGLRLDQNIVNVDNDTLVQHIPENVINEGLKH